MSLCSSRSLTGPLCAEGDVVCRRLFNESETCCHILDTSPASAKAGTLRQSQSGTNRGSTRTTWPRRGLFGGVRSIYTNLVGRTGFEPVTFSVSGRIIGVLNYVVVSLLVYNLQLCR